MWRADRRTRALFRDGAGLARIDLRSLFRVDLAFMPDFAACDPVRVPTLPAGASP